MVLPRRTVIGYLTKHGPLFQPKRSKTKTNRDLQAHALGLCASMVHVIASNSGWFMSLFAPVVIGHGSYFGFGFSCKTHLTNLWYKLFDCYWLSILWNTCNVSSLKRPKTLISLTKEHVSLQLFQRASGFILQKGRISFLYIDKCNKNSMLAMCHLTENSKEFWHLYD